MQGARFKIVFSLQFLVKDKKTRIISLPVDQSLSMNKFIHVGISVLDSHFHLPVLRKKIGQTQGQPLLELYTFISN